MPRSRPTSNPISYHRHTKQYYVTRGGKRLYLGSDKEQALRRYHEVGLSGTVGSIEQASPPVDLSAKELANRFLAAQRANWRNPQGTLKSYRDWVGRFLKDHRQLRVAEFTIERFASWKLSLKERGYSPESINHYLSAVRAMFRFAEDTGLMDKAPKLKRVRNEPKQRIGSAEKPIYSADDVRQLVSVANVQLKAMVMLALNCGFGPKDLHDLTWQDIKDGRITLPRSKTGVCQTYLIWPETQDLLDQVKERQVLRATRRSKRIGIHPNETHVFLTKFLHPWNKDSIAEEFRKLCKKAGLPCYGFYRLRHCASTAMSLVANPHIHRRFMRHSQLQQQVAYTHTPDAEVDTAVMKAREKLLGLGRATSNPERNRGLG